MQATFRSPPPHLRPVRPPTSDLDRPHSPMHRVLVLGAGKIGRMIGRFLMDSGDYDVLVGDVSDSALERIAKLTGAEVRRVDATNPADLAAALAGRDTVLSALSYHHNPAVAHAALASGASYFDLTEDVATSDTVAAIAEKAGRRPDLHAAVRTGPGLHFDCRQRSHRLVRAGRHGADAGRRAAAVSDRRAEIQSHLVDRRPDQRVLQSVRSDPRGPADRMYCRWKGSSSSRSTACATKPSTPAAAWARCAIRWMARSAN